MEVPDTRGVLKSSGSEGLFLSGNRNDNCLEVNYNGDKDRESRIRRFSKEADTL